MSFTPVGPVPALPPGIGLVTAARLVTGDTQWLGGMTWRPERCIASQGWNPCAEAPVDPVNADAADPLVYYQPQGFRVVDRCSASSGTRAELPGRVRRQVEAVTSFRAARELWTGELTQAEPFTAPPGSTQTMNLFLAAAAAVVVPGVWSPVNGLALLEQEARTAAGGQDVFLHVTPAVANLVQAGGMFRRVGNIIYTPTDGVVVPDAGYPGTAPGGAAPAAGHVWAYATGPVEVRLGPIDVPDESWTLDRATNQWVTTGERMFAATFDPCVHFAIELALPAEVT